MQITQYNAKVPQPEEVRSVSVAAVVGLGYNIFAFSKEAPLQGRYESPHSVIIAKTPFTQLLLSSAHRMRGEFPHFVFPLNSFISGVIPSHSQCHVLLPSAPDSEMFFFSLMGCDISPQLINVHISLFPLL